MRTLNSNGETQLSKKNIAAHILFAKDHLDKTEGYWNHFVDGWCQNRFVFFFKNEKLYVWSKESTALLPNVLMLHKNLILSGKHKGDSMVVWAWFVAPGMSELYKWFLKEYIRTSVHELILKRKWFMQQDNIPPTFKSWSCGMGKNPPSQHARLYIR